MAQDFEPGSRESDFHGRISTAMGDFPVSPILHRVGGLHLVEGADEGKADPTANRAAEEQKEMEIAVCYLFQRWNLKPQMREKEEAWFREPG